MRIAVISCWNYRDAWVPFFGLLDHFWPDHPKPWLVLDELRGAVDLPSINIYCAPRPSSLSWCHVLAHFAKEQDEPICLFQEDFVLCAPVNVPLIERGLEQMKSQKAGCVRLYPCPGGEEEYGDPHFAIVPRGTPYRISCQAGLWAPDYLARILTQSGEFPWQFELLGSPASNSEPESVLAFKRNVKPWPVEYLCSGISKGLWDPNAKKLCDSLGIEADWTMRGFASA